MSSVAKKMLERYGWKDGEGLGKGGKGVKTYIKVERRDPKTAAGLGHSLQSPQPSTFALELDAVYSELKTQRRVKEENCGGDASSRRNRDNADCKELKKRQRTPSSDSSSSSDEEPADITRMSDSELLRRCGGVRLGRAGRHRFFDGKLRRIEESQRNK
ncbi:G patch domain [Trypanosoma vivax]|nr:G patch domain [Trypanosoma vivax]